MTTIDDRLLECRKMHPDWRAVAYMALGLITILVTVVAQDVGKHGKIDSQLERVIEIDKTQDITLDKLQSEYLLLIKQQSEDVRWIRMKLSERK